MSAESANAIAGFLYLLTHHRGEPWDAYDDVAEGYDLYAAVWDGVVGRHALARVNRLIGERVPPGGTVLDAAAGTGERTLTILAHSQPARVVALDASTEMLRVARQKITDPRVEFIRGSALALPFPDDHFDVVVSTWLLSILREPREAVSEFLRVLKPGGTVIYAFVSLPEGAVGRVVRWIADNVAPEHNPLTHTLSSEEQPLHRCAFASHARFVRGLMTVATLGKCCDVLATGVPCSLGPTDT